MLPRRILRNRVLRWILAAFLIALIAFITLLAPAVYREANRDSEVAKLMPMLGLRPEMTVAEVGAGEGRMLKPLAERMGPNSHIFATEIDPAALRQLRESIGSQLQNVTIIEGTPEQTHLPKECCDAIIMSDAYHHFTNPASMNASLFQALRPTGRLAIIDFAPTPWLFWLQRPTGVPEDREGHGVQARLVTAELGRAGFVIEQVVEDWWRFVPRRYCLIAHKPSRQVHSR